jgi:hypothetical protein
LGKDQGRECRIGILEFAVAVDQRRSRTAALLARKVGVGAGREKGKEVKVIKPFI